jgi:hypothetical protein
VTSSHRGLGRLKPLWLSAWPFWSLLVFASLAAVRFLPGGYPRAALATPILLLVPGSLTLGAILSPRRRPLGAAFVCYAALLGMVWSAFVSLVLYAIGILITADNTFWCLLLISAVLACVAQARNWLGLQGQGRRVARDPELLDPGLSDAEADEIRTRSAVRSGWGFEAIVAAVAGIGLLAGGLFLYEHLPQPATSGYTWLAWTKLPTDGDVAVGATGDELTFQIVHHQSNTTTFNVSAVWLGSPARMLAKPLIVSVGPNQTFRGTLFIPPLPNGCTFRIALALTALHQIDPLTNKPETWSINADVHDPNKTAKTCQ